jgi:hypothetical protein
MDIPSSRPGMSRAEIGLWGLHPHLWYHPSKPLEAWRLLVECGSSDLPEGGGGGGGAGLAALPGYRYDLVDLGRNVLSKYSTQVGRHGYREAGYCCRTLWAWACAMKLRMQLSWPGRPRNLTVGYSAFALMACLRLAMPSGVMPACIHRPREAEASLSVGLFSSRHTSPNSVAHCCPQLWWDIVVSYYNRNASQVAGAGGRLLGLLSDLDTLLATNEGFMMGERALACWGR